MSSSNGFNLFGASLSTISIAPPPPAPSYNGFNEFGQPENGLNSRVLVSGVQTTVGYNEFAPVQPPVPVTQG